MWRIDKILKATPMFSRSAKSIDIQATSCDFEWHLEIALVVFPGNRFFQPPYWISRYWLNSGNVDWCCVGIPDLENIILVFRIFHLCDSRAVLSVFQFFPAAIYHFHVSFEVTRCRLYAYWLCRPRQHGFGCWNCVDTTLLTWVTTIVGVFQVTYTSSRHLEFPGTGWSRARSTVVPLVSLISKMLF